MQNCATNNLSGKRVLVVGAGRAGLAAFALLEKLGARAALTDSAWGDSRIACVSGFDMLVVSPGVAMDNELVALAKGAGISVVSELDLSLGAKPNGFSGRILAVTGTNGKSSVVSMISQSLSSMGLNNKIVGNFGVPLSAEILDLKPDCNIILEASSYMLEGSRALKPDIAIITNIAKDHLKRHKTMKNYVSVKAKIFENMYNGSKAILNYDCKYTPEFAKKIKARVFYFSTKQKVLGAYLKDDGLYLNLNPYTDSLLVCRLEQLKLKGLHNIENYLASLLACYFVFNNDYVIEQLAKGLTSARGLTHRTELVRAHENVTYINDSKATNVHSTISALNSLSEKCVLILGGADKGECFKDLFTNPNLAYAVVIGENAGKILSAAKALGFSNILNVENLEVAIKGATEFAKQKGIKKVLFSPASASFDRYKNFEERGEHFKQLVLDL
ncbi:MAG: UDP-N-acetylmuramoyl-L-alanine--D-glutamate ligase [Firmicutes bacterium]|nr:UDP-N-acetylmuramoyl-L-alanine--D-glutamate ligase [Bacillota bacterium]